MKSCHVIDFVTIISNTGHDVTIILLLVTLGRALELGHKPAVMYSLASETSNLFTLSADALKTLDQVQFGKWITYLQMKASFYESYVCYYSSIIIILKHVHVLYIIVALYMYIIKIDIIMFAQQVYFAWPNFRFKIQNKFPCTEFSLYVRTPT